MIPVIHRVDAFLLSLCDSLRLLRVILCDRLIRRLS